MGEISIKTAENEDPTGINIYQSRKESAGITGVEIPAGWFEDCEGICLNERYFAEPGEMITLDTEGLDDLVINIASAYEFPDHTGDCKSLGILEYTVERAADKIRNKIAVIVRQLADDPEVDVSFLEQLITVETAEDEDGDYVYIVIAKEPIYMAELGRYSRSDARSSDDKERATYKLFAEIFTQLDQNSHSEPVEVRDPSDRFAAVRDALRNSRLDN